MSLATISGSQLTADLKPQLTLLVDDMRKRLDDDAERTGEWRAVHAQAVADRRTAASWTDYLEDQLTQAAVGWLLTSVFVRFCEDNLLLGSDAVWIAGPTPLLRQRALDAEAAFYREDPTRSYREWLEESFSALRANPGTQSLVDNHAAIQIMEPSSYAIEQLLAYWRRTDDDGALVWGFGDPELSTRFLGDLYQDLSDYAKKKYALLQTPEFVEEFILDQTMEPALAERPLDGFKLIDPTCGSGHFLLGAFARLVERWQSEAPGMEPRARVNKALESIHGVDLNPFAIAIAKFRLIVAAMKASGDKSLVNVPKYTLNLAAGDSLLYGPERGGQHAFESEGGFVDKDEVVSGFAYTTEDKRKLKVLLEAGQYDAVVGNPPYITVSDKALNARYREIYRYCKGKYALTVPFMERFFQLARVGDRPGWVGKITANSFMKREFGVPLIEKYLSRLDLRIVVDMSGAYIPGHGTPTVILVARNRSSSGPVHAVLGIQGEPGAPDNPAEGHVWSSIVANANQAAYEDQWISVTDLARSTLETHPWSLSGGGASDLVEIINHAAVNPLIDPVHRIGIFGMTNCDPAFLVDDSTCRRRRLEAGALRRIVLGDEVRDYIVGGGGQSIFPYSASLNLLDILLVPECSKYLWPNRTEMGNRATFNKVSYFHEGRAWYGWHQVSKSDQIDSLTITFAFVATHNHFVLDRGGKVFKQSAPVIKLPEGATEEDHLRLLGVLNSSTACFWLKQNSHDKGNGGIGGGIASQEWERFYEFTGTTLKDFPLQARLPLDRATVIDRCVGELASVEPAAVLSSDGPALEALGAAHTASSDLRARMISVQEDLDWEVYKLYGLLDEDLNLPVGSESPGLVLGERAFEIALARRMAAGEVETEWFNRHASTPITEIPSHWPAEYRELVQRRLDAIESNKFIGLLERPEYKRRWAGESWETKLERALRDWLLDRLEEPALWRTAQGVPQPQSVGELAGIVGRDPEFIAGLDMWAGRKDAPIAETLVKLVSDQAVPYLAAYRYKDSGLRKRAEWERVWDLQRDEDAGLIKAEDIPVPPKYTTADFQKPAYWSHRGKLDVPKERFILYPGAGRVTDPTPLLGWAGWNHAEQGLALATIHSLREGEGADRDQLVPLVAGIAELLPWVKQWHSEIDPNFGLDLAEYLEGQLVEMAQQVGVPISELNQWRPPAPVRGRKKKG